MRSGTFKENYAGLIVLTDNPVKWVWAAVALTLVAVFPLVANSYTLN
ncbi:MAG: branched-chain amino acid ABC transporter permease, partial [Rubrivivax sp.]|nr:branched-chain amino acid ABC transporter permease [Rubrivivax sp.]